MGLAYYCYYLGFNRYSPARKGSSFVASLIPCTLFLESAIRDFTELSRLIIWQHSDILCHLFMHTQQIEVRATDVVSMESKFPDSNTAITSLVIIATFVEEFPSDGDLDLHWPHCAGRLLSINEGLHSSRLPHGGEILSTFIMCFSKVLIKTNTPML